MTNEYFVGVDGGGTRSRLRIETIDGKLLGEATAGPGSIRLSVEKSWQAIRSSFNKALKESGLDINDPNNRFHAGMGLAGCEISEAYQKFIETPHPFTSLVLKSDAHAACLGAHGGEDGAIIIIGTGVIGYKICQGKFDRVGGWGFPQGDEGGGAWLGLEAIRLTMHWIDGRIEETPLLRAIFEEFGGNVTRLISWTSYAKSSDFGHMAPIVVQQMHLQDPHAIRLMKDAARHIDEVAAALGKIRTKTELPFSLFGGLVPYISPLLGEALRQHIQPRKFNATVGAIMMAKKQLGLPLAKRTPESE